ncbi:hypothetical protein [Sagittula sp. SSi028]|uniref:hypothetical protein n=1 Tax=Sagittula sp. SSi028 TaxID=3400636 RepID=UPI003AF5CBD9
MMRAKLAETPDMDQGSVTLGNAASSSGALSAALAAGPTRRSAQPVEDSLPDDDTIEATAVMTEVPLDTVDAELPETSEAAALDETVAQPTLEGTAPAPRPSTPDSVAAKLDRIRAVVASTDAADTTAEDVPAEDALTEDVQDDADLIELEDAIQDEAEDAPAQDIAIAEAVQPEAEPQTLADATSVSGEEVDDDALSALLSELESDSQFEDQFPEAAEDTAETVDATDTTLADTIASLMGQSDALAEAIEPDAARGSDGDADEIAEDDSDNWFADDLDDGEVMADDTMADPEPEAPAPQPIRARVVKVKRADFLRAVESGQIEEVEEDDTAETSAPMADQSTLSPEEEDELARELAAVKAELTGEFDDWADTAEDDDADDNWYDDTPEVAQADTPAPLRLDNPMVAEVEDSAADLRWSPEEAVDDIADRTAAAIADTPSDDVADQVRDTARKTVKMASPARAMLTERNVADDDTSRLMDQTASEMDEPEGNRRRTAIAHLRAAVAATKADRLLGNRADKKDEQEPYREDLASVVRPRRPQTGSARTERPAEPAARPAPLKLVAEQRVEDQPQAPVASDLPRTVPVRPRRVQRVEEPARDLDPGSEGFVAYAEQVGATDLPDLLEAAAAYMAYVEGRDQFSRPQLMSTVRLAEHSESSREDRLRSFGQLLREGKIKKTAGGRFTAADHISFKPDRAVG